jgi:hypothetical protein
MPDELARQLRAQVRAAWDSDLGATRAEQLEEAARPGYASCLKDAFKTGATRDKYESCASTNNISASYRRLWGKKA